MKSLAVALVVMAVLTFCSGKLHAQSTSATLSGTIIDSQGAAIPNASIAVQNQEEGFKRTVKCNSAGAFTIAGLPPGNYTVAAITTIKGFAPAVYEDVALQANDSVTLQITLKVAGGKESVTVVDRPSLMSDSGTVSTDLDRQFIQELPLDGRSIQTLIAVAPGMQNAAASSQNPGQFSVNGMRSDANNFTIDGVSANFGSAAYAGSGGGNSATNGSAPATDVNGGFSNLVSIDALQEIHIQTSSFAPEFGRNPGAQVSLVTRSGEQKFHGSAYDYFRNDALDASDWFDNALGVKKEALRYNDFGGTFGGPIPFPWSAKAKHNTFFFFSYEGSRFTVPQAAQEYIVPSNDARANAPNSIAASILNAFPVPTTGAIIYADPIALGMPGTCMPGSSDFFCGPNGGQEWTGAWSNPSRSNSYGLRLDHHFNDKYSIFARYNRANSNATTAGIGNSSIFATNTDTLTIGTTLVLTPRMLNQFTINGSSSRTNGKSFLNTIGGATPIPDSGLYPGGCTTCAVSISIFGLDPSLAAITTLSANGKNASDNRQINGVDDFSYQVGSHQLKFGADYRYLSPIHDPNTFSSSYLYFGVDDELFGTVLPGVYQGTAPGATADEATAGYQYHYALEFKAFSAYAQDSWKATPRLTLTYGTRWEFNPAPSGKHGASPFVLQSLNLNTLDFDYLTFAPAGTPMYQASHVDFAPRLGFAYRFNSAPGRETTLRGGGGMFYDTGQTGLDIGDWPYTQSFLQYGGSLILGHTDPLVFPAPADYLKVPAANTLPSPGNLASTTVVAPGYRLPRSYQWNVTLDRSLGKSTVFTLAYVASIGKDLQRRLTYFFQQPGTNETCAQTLGSSNALQQPCSSDFTSLQVLTNQAESRYNSLQASLHTRMGRSLEAIVNYTWAHGMDDDSTDAISTSIASARIDWGNSDYDIRNSFNTTFFYSIPSAHVEKVVDAISRDWMVNGLVTVRSAPPFNVYAGTAVTPSYIGGGSYLIRADTVPGKPVWINSNNQGGTTVPGGRFLNAAAFATAPSTVIQGDLPRNSLRAFDLAQFNVGVHRIFPVYERLKLQFRAEFFNIFNHPNFGTPINTLGTPAPGTSGFPIGFGEAQATYANSLGGGATSGGYNPLFQTGGPRAIQLALRLDF